MQGRQDINTGRATSLGAKTGILDRWARRTLTGREDHGRTGSSDADEADLALKSQQRTDIQKQNRKACDTSRQDRENEQIKQAGINHLTIGRKVCQTKENLRRTDWWKLASRTDR